MTINRRAQNASKSRGVRLHPSCRVGERVVFDNKYDRRGQIIAGKHCQIGDYCQFHAGGGVIRLGREVSLGPFCLVYGHGNVTIGDQTRMGPMTIIVSSDHVFEDPDVPIMLQGIERKEVIIGDDVWIGAGARILGGVRIGDHAVIGAGAVVTKHVFQRTIVAGVPAREIGKRGRCRTCGGEGAICTGSYYYAGMNQDVMKPCPECRKREEEEPKREICTGLDEVLPEGD